MQHPHKKAWWFQMCVLTGCFFPTSFILQIFNTQLNDGREKPSPAITSKIWTPLSESPVLTQLRRVSVQHLHLQESPFGSVMRSVPKDLFSAILSPNCKFLGKTRATPLIVYVVQLQQKQFCKDTTSAFKNTCSGGSGSYQSKTEAWEMTRPPHHEYPANG